MHAVLAKQYAFNALLTKLRKVELLLMKSHVSYMA